MLLQDPDTIPPVLPVEVKAQAIPNVGVPLAAREGAGESLRCPQEAHIVHMGLVFCLADWQPDPFNCGLCTMHSLAVSNFLYSVVGNQSITS